MSMMIIAALLAPVASTPAAAQAPAKPPVYVMDVDEGKVVCRSIMEAGSRIPSRVCRTEAQWAQLSRNTEEDLRRASNNRSSDSPGAGK